MEDGGNPDPVCKTRWTIVTTQPQSWVYQVGYPAVSTAVPLLKEHGVHGVKFWTTWDVRAERSQCPGSADPSTKPKSWRCDRRNRETLEALEKCGWLENEYLAETVAESVMACGKPPPSPHASKLVTDRIEVPSRRSWPIQSESCKGLQQRKEVSCGALPRFSRRRSQ